MGDPSRLDATSGTTFTASRRQKAEMTIRPAHVNAYEFVVVSSLRAQQLLAGCTARLPGAHSATTMAQMEVAAGCVKRAATAEAGPVQCVWQR